MSTKKKPMSIKSFLSNWTQFVSVSSSASISERVSTYGDEVSELLFNSLLDVIRKRSPEIENIILGKQELRHSNETLLTYSLQAYGIWFQLLSTLDQHVNEKRLRLIETEIGHDQVPGTFAQVVSQAASEGVSAEQLQSVLENSSVFPTITAHPTEAKRVTVLEIHHRIYMLLKQLEKDRSTPREREMLKLKVRDEIDLLWLTGEIRLEKPTVQQEVSWGMHFFKESLYEGVVELYSELERVLNTYYPGQNFNVPAFFQFGSWIGGDRDGNPFVTTEVTEHAVKQSAKATLQHYLTELRELGSYLSIANHSVELPEHFYDQLNSILEKSGEAETIKSRNPGEVFRQITYCIIKRLTANLYQLSTDSNQSIAYKSVSEVADDLRVIEDGLIAAKCESLCMNYIRPFRHGVEAFGFHTTSLDLRQNSTVTTEALQDIWKIQNGADQEPPAKESKEWRKWLLDKLKEPLDRLPQFSTLTDMSAATLDLMRLIVTLQEKIDRDAFGVFILSMTQSSEDIIGVYLLAKYAGLFTDEKNVDSCRILIVPLLETIDDLRNGPAILEDLLDIPFVQRTIKEFGGHQEIMVGYSDSNKDGGCVCSTWEVSKAQTKIYQAGAKHGIQISFFHGRGGSVSRGGAPAGRAIAAQPAGTINGRMRVTEQGEVVSGKFANREVAEQQMELLAASILSHTLFSEQDPNLQNRAEYDEVMEALSGTSQVAYRGLVDYPGLVDFYQYASPVEELTLMKIGSRPARRFGANSLDDLRAIPWVFAWTQNRLMVTGWYGYGSAIQQLLSVRGDQGLAMLHEMFEQCPIFRLITDNVEKMLFLTDFDVANEYASLVKDQKNSQEIMGLIKAERELTEQMILKITQETELCKRFPNFHDTMVARIDGIKQIGLEQVKLVQQFRSPESNEKSQQSNLVPLLLSINCVAAGLGWTG
ncbi:MAG: phosphoenolpyruvate carboxylase [Gammaproteobacteria bacterium]